MPPSARLIERASNRYPKLPLRAAMVANFIETFCVLSKGRGMVGKPFVLIPWQYEALAGMYPGLPGDDRAITRALISIARKNGKTEFASAITLAHLCGPEAGVGDELICAAAANQDQAGLVWNGVKGMAQANPKINRFMTYRENRIIWKLDSVNNYCHTISTKTSSAQGLLPAFWTYDEIAESKERGLYEALHYGQIDAGDGGSGMGLIVSTRSTLPTSVFTDLHDDVVLGQQQGRNKNWFIQVFSADAAAKDLYTMEQVAAANPSMGHIISSKMLEQDLENAKANPSARSEFRARRLNIETGSSAALVDPTAWAECARVDPETKDPILELPDDAIARLKGERAVLAIDLGSTRSMTSVAVYFPDQKHVIVKSWMARSQVEKNETIHKVPYSSWADAGHLELIAAAHDGGMTYQPIAEFIHHCIKTLDVRSWRYDGWNINRLFDALVPMHLLQEQYPMKGILDKFVPSMKDYGDAITEFEDMIYNQRVTHDSNPVTTMGINVCQVEIKNRGSDQVKVPEKNKQHLPNDPAIAIIMAICNRGLVLEPKQTLTFAQRQQLAAERAAAKRESRATT